MIILGSGIPLISYIGKQTCAKQLSWMLAFSRGYSLFAKHLMARLFFASETVSVTRLKHHEK